MPQPSPDMEPTRGREAEPVDVRSRLLDLERSCRELLGKPTAGRDALPAQQLERLLEISRAMNQIHDRDELLSYVRDRLRELFDAENSFVILLDPENRPTIQSTNLDAQDTDALPISETILKEVLRTRQALLIDNAAESPELRNRSSVLRYKIASVLCAPLIVGDNVIGVLQFDQRGTPCPFSNDDLRLLSLFADHAATAFKNLELIERLQETVEEIRSAQASIVKAERMSALGEMAAGIAHDFNNTLLVAIGHCDVLLARDEIDSDARKSVETIRTCALDAANTVRRMQTVARGTQGDGARTSVRLDQIVEELPLFTRHKWWDEARRRGASVDVEVKIDASPPVAATPSEIREVLVNLVFNAADSIDVRGTIKLTTGQEGEMAFVSVADDGSGMDGATRERAFQPFFSTKGARGCGFGLSTCEGIAQRLGGRIDCTSELGKGSCFTLWLPISDRPAALPSAPSQAATREYRLLVVDDDELVLETMHRLLQTLGHKATTLSRPQEALGELESGKYDAILTDLGMPTITGTDLARSIRAAELDIPIILLTGWNTDVDLAGPMGKMIDHLIAKPVTLDSLRSALTAVLEPS